MLGLSLVAVSGATGPCCSRALERRFSHCGAWFELFHAMWDRPRPGIEPVSSALAGEFSSTVPSGKYKKGLGQGSPRNDFLIFLFKVLLNGKIEKSQTEMSGKSHGHLNVKNRICSTARSDEFPNNRYAIEKKKKKLL